MLYPIHMILSHHGKPESGLYRLRYRRDPAEDGPLLEAMGIKLAGHYVAKESRHLFWDGWP